MKQMRFELEDDTYHKLVGLKGCLKANDWQDLIEKILIELGSWYWDRSHVTLNPHQYNQIITMDYENNRFYISPPSGCEVDIIQESDEFFVVDNVGGGKVRVTVQYANAEITDLGEYEFKDREPIPLVLKNREDKIVDALTITPAMRLRFELDKPLKNIGFKLRAVIKVKMGVPYK